MEEISYESELRQLKEFLQSERYRVIQRGLESIRSFVTITLLPQPGRSYSYTSYKISPQKGLVFWDTDELGKHRERLASVEEVVATYITTTPATGIVPKVCSEFSMNMAGACGCRRGS